ncbi:methyl-accepting chemotaxis protein [Rugamonas apoptosis]|uniref:Type IV pili methyl-accepting chemotaxis transducer N-terminal domain-containing protein n=1 Tax=Rugamonas apoptosis TaxID=2758570 RepID=A0A7W2FC89_9BURK|nr:methyl-accepting chemotaxis protein [Rugamonas apoptosis]MBA5689096.1 type IV pili methyl-accepting chemotaxis transducer N-terminal domain-containing protein [Rugamonas apoptosis]
MATSKPPSPLSGEVFGALINLSGRRRFTSQRLVLFAVLAAKPDPSALGAARDALTAFRDAHTALVDGSDTMPGIFCEELERVYHGKEQGHARIKEFIDHAERTLHAIEHNFRSAPGLVDELVRYASSLLPLLNHITQVYEELSKQDALQMKRRMSTMMNDIMLIAKQARMVAFNAQIVAARAGHAGREFAVVAGLLSEITGEIDTLVSQAVVQ